MVFSISGDTGGGRWGLNNKAAGRRQAVQGDDLLADGSTSLRKLRRESFPPDVTGGSADLREPSYHADPDAVAQEQGSVDDVSIARGSHNHDRTYAQERAVSDKAGADVDYIAGYSGATDAPFDPGGGVAIDYQQRVVSWSLTAGLQPSAALVYAQYSQDGGTTYSRLEQIGRVPPGVDQFFYRAESRWNFAPTASPATTARYYLILPSQRQGSVLQTVRTGTDGKVDPDFVPDVVGDSGSGGDHGLVPAPSSGDAAAGKFLKADGTWAVPPAVNPLVYDDASTPGGNTVFNTITATLFASTFTIPANYLELGTLVRIRLWGVFSTDAVAPTMRIRVKIGATVVDTQAVTLTAGVTGLGWSMEVDAIISTAGASGFVDAMGSCQFAVTATSSAPLVPSPATAHTIGIDTTATQVVSVQVQWGTANVNNSISLRLMTVEIVDVVAP